jgi:competence protein ComEC
MGVVVLAAAFTGRPARAVPALAGAVLALVLVDPFLARTPGFAMSVLATAAILLVAPPWTQRLAAHLPRPVAAALAVPAAAQLACTPVIVGSFGRLTPYAVVANLLAAPAVAPASLGGVAAAVTAEAVPPVATALAWLAGLPVAWLVVVARTVSRLPMAAATWPTGWRGVASLLGVAAVASAAVRVTLRRGILGRWRR